MKRLLWIVAILLSFSVAVGAQVSGPTRKIAFGTADPAACRSNGNNIFFRTDTGALKVCTSTNTWSVVGGGAGSGDVTGPASATDGVPVLFDGTTGKLLKNSTPTGMGNPVLQTTPTLITPILGVASATSLSVGTTTATAAIDNKGSVTGHTGISGDVIVGSEVAYGTRIRPTLTASTDGGDMFGVWLNPDFQDAGHLLVGHLNLYSGPPQASFTGTFTPAQTVYGTNVFATLNASPSHFASVAALNEDNTTNSTFGINTTVESRHAAGTKSQLAGIEADAYTSAAGNVTTMAGFIAFTQHSGAGTVGKQVGLFATSGASTGTATLGAGVYIANGSMAPTTKHGLYVETQTGGGTNYSLFVNGGLTHLGGILEAGTGPTTLTDAAGKILSAALNTVGVAQGGTGLTTLTANNVMLGNGTSAPLFVAPGTSGNVLTSNGTTWTSAAAAGGGGLTVGTSTITSGTTTRILYDNAGVLGEYTITGTGTVVAMQTSPALTTPKITTGIQDANGNSMLAFTATASAVDGFTLTNAATANPATVTMAATGSDTNIRMGFTSKGAGNFVFTTGGLLLPEFGAESGTMSVGFTAEPTTGIWHQTGSMNFRITGTDTVFIKANGLQSATGLALGGATLVSGLLITPQTITAGGTTGNQTINKAAGTVNIAAAGTSVTVTNSLVTASSQVFAVIRTNDSTAVIKNVVPASGSFVITLNAAATAEVSIGWWVLNQ